MPQETMLTVIECRIYFRDSCIFLLHRPKVGLPIVSILQLEKQRKGRWGSRDTRVKLDVQLSGLAPEPYS